MMTEEAKKKWCPLSMVDEDSYQKCVGSDCMAWRWKETFEQMPSKGEATPEKDKPNGEGWHYELVQGSGVWRRPTFVTGYCGLAGKDGT